MVLTDSDTIKHLEKCKYGGLSNVMHRYNIAGETHINTFKYENNKVISYDQPQIMTKVSSKDFNGLYPSVSASIKNVNCPYTDNIMHMPGRFQRKVLDSNEMERLVKLRSSKYYFFVTIKASFPKNLYNKIIHFPPVLRPYYVEEEFDNHLEKKDCKPTRKLTQLLSTMGEFMTFSQYYLWFLIDLRMKINAY
jgi:hypothetical protein